MLSWIFLIVSTHFDRTGTWPASNRSDNTLTAYSGLEVFILLPLLLTTSIHVRLDSRGLPTIVQVTGQVLELLLMHDLFFPKNPINHKRNELSSTAHSNGCLCLVTAWSLNFPYTGKVITYLLGQIVCGIMVGIGSASGSATLTCLLELAARSGTGDLERSRNAI